MDADIIESEKITLILTQEKQAARDAVHYAFAQGLIEDHDAYKTALDEIDNDFNDRITTSKDETQDLIDDRNRIYGEDFGNYDRETDNKLAAEEGFVTSLQDTWLPAFSDTQSSAADYVNDNFIVPVVGEDGKSGYLGAVKGEYDDLNKNIGENMKAAGVTMDDAGDWVEGFKNEVKKDLTDPENPDSVVNQIGETSGAIDDLIKDLTGENGLTSTASGIHTWATSITSDIGDLITQYDDLVSMYEEAN